VIGAIEKAHGSVSILVNNAGVTQDNLAMRMKDSEWDAVIDTNLKSVFRMSKAVLRGMMKARSGRIINITSVVGSSGNPGQIKQLFSNLLSNAIKFRREAPPHVRIRSAQEGNNCIISVQDNGIGIPPQYLTRIFDMYERLHSSARYPGTGMGLALCKKIVERHHGRIWVESTEGRGSTFHFSLPAARE